METIRIMAIAALIVGSGVALLLARGQQAAGIKRTDRATAPTAGTTHGAPLRETVTGVADVPIPNLPGKRLVSRVIDYPPGAASAPHRHARSAFIYAHVLSGQIRSQVDNEPAASTGPVRRGSKAPAPIIRPVSANASDTEPARLLAVVIVDAADEQLTIQDRR